MKVLVVDDSATMRMMVVSTLRKAGFSGLDIEQAEDGKIALDSIIKSVPDIVLVDWNMPNMTGIELLEAVRAEEINVTFGFITTESTASVRKQAIESGASFLISKPFTAESFEKALGKFIN